MVARRDRRDPTAPTPPRVLAPILQFSNLPERALATVRDALDSDESFRRRVWQSLDPDAVDVGARLFLERPDGWSDALAALVDQQVRHDESEELVALHRAASEEVRALSNERDDLRAGLEHATSELAELRSRTAAQEARIESLEESLSEAVSGLEDAREARSRAVRQLKDQESLAVRRLQAKKELESELEALRERIEREWDEGGVNDDPLSETVVSETVVSETVESDAVGSDAVGSDAVGSEGGRIAPGGPQPEGVGGAGSTVASATAGTPPADRELVDRVSSAAVDARALSRELGRVLSSLISALEPLAPDTDPAPAGTDRPPGFGGSPKRSGFPDRGGLVRGGARTDAPFPADPRNVRRRPVRLGRGLSVDSVEGLETLLGLPEILVMVDGYNVTMQGWGHLGIAQQRDSLIGAVTTLQRRLGGSWHLVFDGSGRGQRPAVRAPLGVRVHFTPSDQEADDRLLEFVDEAGAEVPIAVVSSDHRVRDGARSRGANVVSSETLLALVHTRS